VVTSAGVTLVTPIACWKNRLPARLHVGGSHLRLLEALAGPEPLGLAYRTALEHGFAWGAFGDLHLILPGSRRRARRAP
jgi:S-adenosylmethionine:tRNA-ribosyltransferase-isomerase (queuine synthetase)